MDELTNPETPDAILTLKEVASYLRLAERTVYLYAKQGKLPGIKIGTAWRFRRTEIDVWLDEQRRLTRAATTRREGATKLNVER